MRFLYIHRLHVCVAYIYVCARAIESAVCLYRAYNYTLRCEIGMKSMIIWKNRYLDRAH